MLKKMLTLALVLIASTVNAAAANPVATAYYNLALALAEARVAGEACEYDAYQGNVLKNLETAIRLDETDDLRTSALADATLRAAVGANLGYHAAVGTFDSWTGVGLEDALAQSTFFGPASGVVGNTTKIEFKANGVATYSSYVYEDPISGDYLENPYWEGETASWKVLSRGGGVAKLEVTTAAFGTKIYFLENDFGDGYRLREDGAEAGVSAFLAEPSECEI